MSLRQELANRLADYFYINPDTPDEDRHLVIKGEPVRVLVWYLDGVAEDYLHLVEFMNPQYIVQGKSGVYVGNKPLNYTAYQARVKGFPTAITLRTLPTADEKESFRTELSFVVPRGANKK
ncbi:MAG: hypothetical protein DRN30_05020 [Thermoplasmata archaeon]|nr:MAG: hypothetical protein DRN30_05020 [Thermoplasmata archaeon]